MLVALLFNLLPRAIEAGLLRPNKFVRPDALWSSPERGAHQLTSWRALRAECTCAIPVVVVPPLALALGQTEGGVPVRFLSSSTATADEALVRLPAMSYGSSGGAGRSCRGGADQFRWSDVAASKDRESYLGHSLLAPVGRWQLNKDLTWYAKKKGTAGAQAEAEEIAREKATIRQAEEDRRLEALGLKKKVVPALGSGAVELDAADQKQLFGTVKTEGSHDADRVGGLGFASSGGNAPTATADGGMELLKGDTLDGTTGAREQAHLASAGGVTPSSMAASGSAGSPGAVSALSLSEQQQRAVLAEAEAILAKQRRREERKRREKEERTGKEGEGEGKKSKKDKKRRDRSRSRSRSRRSRSRSRTTHSRRGPSPPAADRPSASVSHPSSRPRSRSRDRRERSRSRDRRGRDPPSARAHQGGQRRESRSRSRDSPRA